MLNVGVIGGRRGLALAEVLPLLPYPARICAVADISTDALCAWKARFSDIELYSDERGLLDDPVVDAVYIATPLLLHARQSVEALNAGKHVLCEVPACVSIEEGKKIIEAARSTQQIYMMAENFCFLPEHRIIRELCSQNAFGEIVYVRSSYIHDCKGLMFAEDGEALTWRGELSREVSGNVYPTHSIGPVAQWLGVGTPNGAQFRRITAFTSRQAAISDYAARRFGRDHPFAGADYFRGGDTVVSIIETDKGCVVELVYDTHSSRPSSKAGCLLHGTGGCYVSGRYDCEEGIIWLRAPDSTEEEGATKEREFAPLSSSFKMERPEDGQLSARRDGYSGMVGEFLEAILLGREPEIGARDAVLWSSIMPLSHLSIMEGNVPVEFPVLD